MGRALVTPGIEESLRRQSEAHATVGVANLQPLSRQGFAFGGHKLEATVPCLGETENGNGTLAHTRFHAYAVAALAVIQPQASQNRPAFSNGQVEGPIVSHQDESMPEIHGI